MTAESDTAGRIARKGLRIIDKMLDGLWGLADEEPKRWPANYARQVTDCVLAAVKVQAEERAQAEFEAALKLSPDEIRAALKEYLSSLPYDERVALLGGPAHAQLPAVKEEDK